MGPIQTEQTPRNLISATINRQRTAILIDSGAAVSCVSLRFVHKIGAKIKTEIDSENLTTADGSRLQVIGGVELTVGLKGLLVPHLFYVIDGLHHNALIGLDFMQSTACRIDLKSSLVSFYEDLVILPLQQRTIDSGVLRTTARYVIPARSEALLPTKRSNICPLRTDRHDNCSVIIETHADVDNDKFLVAKSVVLLKPQDRRTMCRVMNPNDTPCVIRKGQIIATISPVDVLSMNGIGNINMPGQNYKSQDKMPTRETKIDVLTEMGLDLKREEVTDAVYNQFCDLLYEYRDIFALSMRDLTGSNIIDCPILTYPDAKPTRSRPYRLNDEMRREVDKQLDVMLEANIIGESEGSQFAAPIVMAKKSSGEWRFCVDMRKLNAICRPLYHELPLIDDVIDVMARNQAKILSVLDLRHAYFQLETTSDTAHKTTFVTPHRGCYYFKRLPMGLSQSPYYMSMALNKLFRFQIGTFLIVYLDDILCCSASPETHLQHLRVVFQKLREANLKLHPKKCHFMLKKTQLFGTRFFCRWRTGRPQEDSCCKKLSST